MAEVTVEHLMPSDGGSPAHIAVIDRYLGASFQKASQVVLRDMDSRQEVHFQGSYGNLSSHSAGTWMAFCLELGQKIILVNTVSRSAYEIVLPPEQPNSCTGLFIEPVASSWRRDALESLMNGFWSGSREFLRNYAPTLPNLWISSTGNRRVMKLSLSYGLSRRLNARAVKVLEFMSGVFRFNILNQDGREMLVGLNSLLRVSESIPFGMDLQTSEVLWGDPTGMMTDTKLYRHFADLTLHSSPRDPFVAYLRPEERQLVLVPTRHPDGGTEKLTKDERESAVVEIDLPMFNPRVVSKWKNCYVVMGQDPDRGLPIWTVVDVAAKGRVVSMRTTKPLENDILKVGTRQEIDSAGRVTVSHWQGVSRVSGIYGDSRCEGVE